MYQRLDLPRLLRLDRRSLPKMRGIDRPSVIRNFTRGYMNVDDWARLSAEERNRLRGEWKLDNSRWMPLLNEVIHRFVREYGDHPLINRTYPTLGTDLLTEPGVVVVTALFPPQRIEDLPDRFLTFPVYQEAIEGIKRLYMRSWELILGNLLGWTPAQICEWAMTYEDELSTGGLVYHEQPVHWAAHLLIPHPLRVKMDHAARYQFCNEATQAIGDPFTCNWDDVREKIRTAVAEAASRNEDERR